MISAVVDGAVELYHDNTKRLETASGGINVGVGITMDGNGIAVSGILTAMVLPLVKMPSVQEPFNLVDHLLVSPTEIYTTSTKVINT